MTKYIYMASGDVAIVDDEDYKWLSQWKWYIRGGYASRSKGTGKKRIAYLMHREIMKAPPELEVDHINGNKLDNRRGNLRLCTRTENVWNTVKSHQDTASSRYKGVTKYERVSGDRWEATVRHNHIIENIGTFTNEIAAANAYNYYSKMYHGEFSKPNDVPYMDKDEWMKYKIIMKEQDSTYTGVRLAKDKKRWQSYIHVNQKQIHIGWFKSEKDAAIAFNKKSLEIYNDFSRLNDIEGIDNTKLHEIEVRQNTREKSSIYRGVNICHVTKNKWIAVIYHNGKDIHIGRYDTEIEAARAYNEMAKSLKGEKAKLNKLDGEESA